MIDPKTANNLIEIERMSLGEASMVLYYADDGKECNIQVGYDCESDLEARMYSRYANREGFLDLFNRFIRSTVTQRWLQGRKNSRFSKPRSSTLAILMKNWEKYKKKYTSAK